MRFIVCIRLKKSGKIVYVGQIEIVAGLQETAGNSSDGSKSDRLILVIDENRCYLIDRFLSIIDVQCN